MTHPEPEKTGVGPDGQGCCATCRYWMLVKHQRPHSVLPNGRIFLPNLVTRKECRHSPPGKDGFPVPANDDWCWQYEPTPAALDAAVQTSLAVPSEKNGP